MKRQVITRWDDTPYLIRYTLFKCRWFSIKVHKILQSDDACMHDHPWAFISIILKHGYIEHTKQPYLLSWYGDASVGSGQAYVLDEHTLKSKWYGVGSILFRRAKHAHRLEILPGRPATTLVITFKREREWGFFTPYGWKFWKKYKQHDTETC